LLSELSSDPNQLIAIRGKDFEQHEIFQLYVDISEGINLGVQMTGQVQELLSNRRLWHIALFLLVVGVFAVYADTFSHTFLINWDDEGYIVKNEAVKGFSTAHLKAAFSSYFISNYAPIQIISYMLDYELWGMSARGFIGTNLLLHALNGILFCRLVEQTSHDRVIAWVAAFIFLFHPVQVESVAWVSQRKNLLAMFFLLISFICYNSFREKGSLKLYSLSVTAFVLGLLSKAVVAIFPLIILLYEFCFYEDEPRLRLKDKVAYFLSAALVGVIALLSHAPMAHAPSGIRDYPGGSLLTTAYTMLPVFVEYLRDCFWPLNLSPYYMTTIRAGLDGVVGLSALFLLFLVVLGGFIFLNNRQLFFGYAIFFIGLLPVSQIVPLITLKNDRYLYFPMFGFAFCMATAISLMLQKLHRWQRLAKSVIVVLLCALPVLTYRQSLIWKDSLTLWTYALTKDPDNQVAWQMLVLAYTRQGNGSAAIEALKQLERLRAEHGPVRGWE
jgi:protein O-mannosyl-transferase